MTTLVVHRPPLEHSIVVPVKQATDEEFNAFLVEHVREFCYRQGVNVSHVTDTELLLRVRHSFGAIPTPRPR